MTNKKENIKTKLADFPEEITEDGLKIYGETSYENQMAVVQRSYFSHYSYSSHYSHYAN